MVTQVIESFGQWDIHEHILLYNKPVYSMLKQEEIPDSSKMLKTAQQTKGYLYKKSRSFMGSWQKRYFLILNHAMIYYPDESLDKKKGAIELGDITKIVMQEDKEFILQTKKRVFQFKCENEKERNLWVASLNLLKESSDMSPIKKFLIRVKKEEKKQEESKSRNQMLNDLTQVFQLMNLALLLKEIQSPRIYNRVFCKRVQSHQFFIAVSIKCLICPELDEELLPQKFIQPYQFNKLYHVKEEKVTEICKMSLIQSIKADSDGMCIALPERKLIKIPIKNQLQARQISETIGRCCQISKQYYNPYNIILKKNVDRLVWLYQNHRPNFQEQVKYRVSNYFMRYKNSPYEPVTILISEFHSLKKNLIETEEACRVLVPPCQNLKAHYIRIAHQLIITHLSEAWEYLYQLFQPYELLSLAGQIYQYWVFINDVISDQKVLDAYSDLTHYFLRKKGEQIKTQIEGIEFSKVQVKRIKNELISNEITNTFFEWLIQLLSNLNQTALTDRVFEDFCKFFIKAFEEFAEYIGRIIDKWSQIPYIIGICNDISKIKKLFIEKAGSQLCQGIIPQSRFITQCAHYVAHKLDETLSNSIKRIFLVVFSSIDKKILNRPFLELDIAKICFQVLQRLEPVKKRVDQFVQNEIIMLSFDQICFFFFTCLLKRKILVVKNSQETYAKAIQKGMTEIQQYYCNIQTEVKVKHHLREVSFLRDILVCSEILIQQYCKELKKVFGLAFSEQCIKNILKIRQIPEEKKQKIYQQCLEILKSNSSEEDCTSRVESDQYQSRPRTSTLTSMTFLAGSNVFQTELVAFMKHGVEGMLFCKKVEKKGIPSFAIQSYYKLSKGKLLELKSKGSSEIVSTLDLNKMEKCYLENLKQSTFIVEFKTVKYHFQAASRDEAGKWVQGIYSQSNQPFFDNKMISHSKKQTGQGLFKDFQADPATTDTLKKKRTQSYDLDQLQDKRNRRKKEIKKKSSSRRVSPSPSPSKKKKGGKEEEGKKAKEARLKKSYGEEGSCCSKGLF